MNTEVVIERFIIDKLMSQGSQPKIDPDESLFTIGVLDSLAFLQLIVLIEEQFGVTIEDGEVIPDNFETINRIKAFLEKKQQGR